MLSLHKMFDDIQCRVISGMPIVYWDVQKVLWGYSVEGAFSRKAARATKEDNYVKSHSHQYNHHFINRICRIIRGFRSPAYRHAILNLVSKGFVVLAYQEFCKYE